MQIVEVEHDAVMIGVVLYHGERSVKSVLDVSPAYVQYVKSVFERKIMPLCVIGCDRPCTSLYHKDDEKLRHLREVREHTMSPPFLLPFPDHHVH